MDFHVHLFGFQGRSAKRPSSQNGVSVFNRCLYQFTTAADNRRIDLQKLSDWVMKVKALAAAKDLSDIGDQRIGFVLAHAPQDADEPFWPPSAVCQVIETAASEQIERGFAIECFNKRGAYSKGLNEGGEQERELANRYKAWANATLKYPRTSAMLITISEDWIQNAERADVEAEKSKMKR